MESKLFRLLYKEGYVNEGNNKIIESGIKRIEHLVQDIALALLVGCLMKSIGVSIVMEIRNCREIICIFLESMLIYVMNEFSDSGGHFHGT